MNPNDATKALQQIYSWIKWIAGEIAGIGILVLIAGTVAKYYGFRVSFIPSIDHIALAYIAGAWFLWRK